MTRERRKRPTWSIHDRRSAPTCKMIRKKSRSGKAHSFGARNSRIRLDVGCDWGSEALAADDEELRWGSFEGCQNRPLGNEEATAAAKPTAGQWSAVCWGFGGLSHWTDALSSIYSFPLPRTVGAGEAHDLSHGSVPPRQAVGGNFQANQQGQ
jgi:hypothetical protein